MNGFEFVLLAIRGRLAEGNVPAADRQRLEGFLKDYSRIAQAYRERRASRQDVLVVHGRLAADVTLVTSN